MAIIRGGSSRTRKPRVPKVRRPAVPKPKPRKPPKRKQVEQKARIKQVKSLAPAARDRRLVDRYGGEAARQKAVVRQALKRQVETAEQKRYVIETIKKTKALAKERASIRREQNVLQRRAAILSKSRKLSIKEVMTAFPKLEPYELGKLEKKGLTFRSVPTMKAMEEYAGQYDPFSKEVRLTPWTDYPILEHEVGAHATQQLNPGQLFQNMPSETISEQLPYSGAGYILTPAAQIVTDTYPEYGERLQEKLAWTAQDVPYGGIDPETFYDWMYRPEYQTNKLGERQYTLPQTQATAATLIGELQEYTQRNTSRFVR